ncbi:MAG: hypothetical protein J1F27_08150 [Prevotellaceae bacterium]|nr:hypothetical protein [Prevotellaceae bacterium]
MNTNKYGYFLISFLVILILGLSLGIGQIRDRKARQDLENELEYVKIKQNRIEGHFFENNELNKIIGVDLSQEYVRTLDDMIYRLGDVDQAFPKVYIYFSSSYCKSCVDYVMGKLQQVNDSLGESSIGLLFHNYDLRQLYISKMRENLRNDMYMVGDLSVIAGDLDKLSKPVVLITGKTGLITMAYSPSEDFDYLFNDYLNILKGNTLFRTIFQSQSPSSDDVISERVSDR